MNFSFKSGQLELTLNLCVNVLCVLSIYRMPFNLGKVNVRFGLTKNLDLFVSF